MSVRNYLYSLHNSPEERSSHLLRGGSLRSRISTWFRTTIFTVWVKARKAQPRMTPVKIITECLRNIKACHNVARCGQLPGLSSLADHIPGLTACVRKKTPYGCPTGSSSVRPLLFQCVWLVYEEVRANLHVSLTLSLRWGLTGHLYPMVTITARLHPRLPFRMEEGLVPEPAWLICRESKPDSSAAHLVNLPFYRLSYSSHCDVWRCRFSL
jgi:hypothetical protein